MTIVGLGHQSLDRTNHMLGYVTSNERLVCGGDAGPQAFGANSIRRLNLSCMACSLFRPGLQWWRSTDVSRYRGHRECVADAPKWPESGCVPFPPCRHRDLIRSTTIDRVESCLAPLFMLWPPVDARQRCECYEAGHHRESGADQGSGVKIRGKGRAALCDHTARQRGRDETTGTAMALLKPDAVAVWRSSTDESTAVVSASHAACNHQYRRQYARPIGGLRRDTHQKHEAQARYQWSNRERPAWAGGLGDPPHQARCRPNDQREWK
jgi:hypothetical protein